MGATELEIVVGSLLTLIFLALLLFVTWPDQRIDILGTFTGHK